MYGDNDIHLVPPLLTTASIFLPHADLFFLIPLALYVKRPRLRAHAIKVVKGWVWKNISITVAMYICRRKAEIP